MTIAVGNLVRVQPGIIGGLSEPFLREHGWNEGVWLQVASEEKRTFGRWYETALPDGCFLAIVPGDVVEVRKTEHP